MRQGPGSAPPLGFTRMPAFIWITNHRMWKVVEPFSESWDVLKAYVTDPCAYVYWSTPRHQNEIKVGDAAYIFRSVDRQGVVARGVVEEAPRHLAATTVSLFAFPDRLTPPGWDEAVAPSSWKTGIRIERATLVELQPGRPYEDPRGQVVHARPQDAQGVRRHL